MSEEGAANECEHNYGAPASTEPTSRCNPRAGSNSTLQFANAPEGRDAVECRIDLPGRGGRRRRHSWRDRGERQDVIDGAGRNRRPMPLHSRALRAQHDSDELALEI